jgi:hypothetical protein
MSKSQKQSLAQKLNLPYVESNEEEEISPVPTPPDKPSDNTNNTKILFLSANPKKDINIDEEINRLNRVLDAARQREYIEIKYRPAVRIDDMLKVVSDFSPNILHFAGHGGEEGIFIMKDDKEMTRMPTAALNMLCDMHKGHLQCVILNACFSAEIATTISQNGMYVVGMNEEVGNKASIEFTNGFYLGVGQGKAYEDAYNYALITLMTNGASYAHTPELWKNGKQIK